MEVSQYICFGDLTAGEYPSKRLDAEPTLPQDSSPSPPSLDLSDLEGLDSEEPRLSNAEEDALLKVCVNISDVRWPNPRQTTTGEFAEWITSFIRRVIQLLENLPEEGMNGSSGGVSEG